MLDNRKFLYVIIFERSSARVSYSPSAVGAAESVALNPDLIDPDLVNAIPALWFCLHLPVSPMDYSSQSWLSLKQRERFDCGHAICLLPADISYEFLNHLDTNHILALLVIPDEMLDAGRFNDFVDRFALGVREYRELEPDFVSNCWDNLSELVDKNSLTIREPVSYIHNLEVGSVLLPFEHLRRQTGKSEILSLNVDEIKLHSADLHTDLTILAIFEKRRATNSEVEEKYPALRQELEYARVQNVIIFQPGVAPLGPGKNQRNLLRGSTSTCSPFASSECFSPLSEYSNECSVHSCICAYEGVAQSGVSIKLPSVSPEMWHALNKLETHFRVANRPRAHYIRRELANISKLASDLLSKADLHNIRKANQISLLSDFPLGLVTLPGHTSPLCCQVPISQRSTLPLTRALQLTLSGPYIHVVNRQFNVLIAECIGKDDHIYKYSSAGWDIIEEELNKSGISVHRRNIESIYDLRRQIEEAKPGVMIISAHGFCDPESDNAGLWIGGEKITYLELDDCPLLVILSACNTSPRGRRVVNIADLFLRDGARAVLSTLIPVHVTKNTNLTTRLLIYMMEAQTDSSKLNSLAEIWHHTQASHAVIDVLSSAKTIQDWAFTQRNGSSVIEEFMSKRSVGRIRLQHVYQDTIDVLQEMADEDGTGQRFSEWINSQGFVPESLFYTLLGWPERILMRPVDGGVFETV